MSEETFETFLDAWLMNPTVPYPQDGYTGLMAREGKLPELTFHGWLVRLCILMF
jgi:hypothetical protein